MTSRTQIRPSGRGTAKPGQSNAQKRFQRLVERIEDTRAQLRAWDEALPPFRAAYEAKVRPLLERERAQVRAWVLALDRAAVDRRWSRKDKLMLRQMLIERSQALLAEQPDDAELAAVFRRHGGEDYWTWQRREAELARQILEGFSGKGRGAMSHGRPEGARERTDEHLQPRADAPPVDDWAAEQATAASERARARARAKEAREKAERARVKKSLREIYRKLVSELHPDREPDEDRRRVKTSLMQKVNEAYGKQDLQTLLEVQLQLTQLDAGALDALDDAMLKRYIGVLSQQAWGLEQDLGNVSRTFMQDYGMAISHRPDPGRLDLVIDRTCRHIRAATKEWAAQAAFMHHTPTLRAWLREIRRQDEEAAGDVWDRDPDDE